MLSKVGIGSAEVDAQLEKDEYIPGEEANGKVVIKGGSVEQKIDKLYIFVMIKYEKEVDDNKVNVPTKIASIKIADEMTENPNETTEQEFSFTMPYEAPLSFKNPHIWIETDPDIKQSIDPNDKDEVQVKPNNIQQEMFDAFKELGFNIRTAKCVPRPFFIKFVQEFEFIPTGTYKDKFDEIELVMQKVTENEIKDQRKHF